MNLHENKCFVIGKRDVVDKNFPVLKTFTTTQLKKPDGIVASEKKENCATTKTMTC
jgi:hypothetical protein